MAGVIVLCPGRMPISWARCRTALEAMRASARPATGRWKPRKSARCASVMAAASAACMIPAAPVAA